MHLAELRREGIEPIDLVAVNLYPFTKAASAGTRGAELQEQIDVGGVTMLRAAAKNYQDVVVVSRPERYQAVLDELKGRGSVSPETRLLLVAPISNNLVLAYIGEHVLGMPKSY